MDSTVLEARKTHMETIMQNTMQETLPNLRKELTKQREAHRNEIAALH